MELRDRVVLITGAKRVGAVVAEILARHGAHIALSYNRSAAEAEAVAERVRSHGCRCWTSQADLTREAACEQLVTGTVRELGRLDVLVTMASIYEATPFDRLTDLDLQRCLDIEVKSAYHCARAAVPHMRSQGGGRVILFSDWLAVSERPRYKGFLPYYVAKKAVVGLTEALALELAEDQILVNSIAPGPILAPPGLGDEEFEAVEKATPVGKWGGGEEIAKAVLALIDSNFITGETIRVDGGRHVR